MSRPAPKPPSALRPLQRTEGASGRQPMPGVRLAAAVAAWIVLSLAAGVATMIIGSEVVPRLPTNTLAVIIVTEVYVLLVVSLLAASGGWSAAVQTFGLRVQPPVVLAGVLLAALSVAALVGYAVVGAWAPLVEELVWVGRDGGRLGSLAPVTTAVTLLRGTLLAALGEELLFRGALLGWLRARLPTSPTMVLTAALWTAVHAGLLVALPYMLVQGVGLGWLRERTVGGPRNGLSCLAHSVVFVAVFALVVGDERATPAHRARSGSGSGCACPAEIRWAAYPCAQRLEDRRSPLARVTTAPFSMRWEARGAAI
jgi:membrane protease YdiL (CAAX protease family)